MGTVQSTIGVNAKTIMQPKNPTGLVSVTFMEYTGLPWAQYKLRKRRPE